MHDHPDLSPHLPSKPFDPDDDYMLAPVMGTIWQSCWEYVLTHEMTETERSAFWHGAHLTHEAMKPDTDCDRGLCCGFHPVVHPSHRRRKNMSDLRKDITTAINRVSAENGSDTPDYILAHFLEASLLAFDIAVRDRDEWHGFKAWPTKGEQTAFEATVYCLNCGASESCHDPGGSRYGSCDFVRPLGPL